jgi:hypothetical protein
MKIDHAMESANEIADLGMMMEDYRALKLVCASAGGQIRGLEADLKRKRRVLEEALSSIFWIETKAKALGVNLKDL